MNLWNPKLPVEALLLEQGLADRLRCDAFRTVGKLARCPREQLAALRYSREEIDEIELAIDAHRDFIDDLIAVLEAENLNQQKLHHLQVFDLLNLPLEITQLGYLLRWQRDVDGRYGEKEIFCVTNGRVYYCTNCRYRDERVNFCGFCMKKLLDEMAERKRKGGV